MNPSPDPDENGDDDDDDDDDDSASANNNGDIPTVGAATARSAMPATGVINRRATKVRWTPEDDARLRKAVQDNQGRSWKVIAAQFSDRDYLQCLHRWKKVINPELVKGPWTHAEDAQLAALVARCGTKRWSQISAQISGRNGKQCRERWTNHLNPEIIKSDWTAHEEALLVAAHDEVGNKWALLAKRLPGRSENDIKNRWNSLMRRRAGAQAGADGAPPPKRRRRQDIDAATAAPAAPAPAYARAATRPPVMAMASTSTADDDGADAAQSAMGAAGTPRRPRGRQRRVTPYDIAALAAAAAVAQSSVSSTGPCDDDAGDTGDRGDARAAAVLASLHTELRSPALDEMAAVPRLHRSPWRVRGAVGARVDDDGDGDRERVVAETLGGLFHDASPAVPPGGSLGALRAKDHHPLGATMGMGVMGVGVMGMGGDAADVRLGSPVPSENQRQFVPDLAGHASPFVGAVGAASAHGTPILALDARTPALPGSVALTLNVPASVQSMRLTPQLGALGALGTPAQLGALDCADGRATGPLAFRAPQWAPRAAAGGPRRMRGEGRDPGDDMEMDVGVGVGVGVGGALGTLRGLGGLTPLSVGAVGTLGLSRGGGHVKAESQQARRPDAVSGSASNGSNGSSRGGLVVSPPLCADALGRAAGGAGGAHANAFLAMALSAAPHGAPGGAVGDAAKHDYGAGHGGYGAYGMHALSHHHQHAHHQALALGGPPLGGPSSPGIAGGDHSRSPQSRCARDAPLSPPPSALRAALSPARRAAAHHGGLPSSILTHLGGAVAGGRARPLLGASPSGSPSLFPLPGDMRVGAVSPAPASPAVPAALAHGTLHHVGGALGAPLGASPTALPALSLGLSALSALAGGPVGHGGAGGAHAPLMLHATHGDVSPAAGPLGVHDTGSGRASRIGHIAPHDRAVTPLLSSAVAASCGTTPIADPSAVAAAAAAAACEASADADATRLLEAAGRRPRPRAGPGGGLSALASALTRGAAHADGGE